jgi:pyrrolidone-carboxylate peptidase
MKSTWLITAFEPFAGRPENNSQAVLKEIRKLVDAKVSETDWNFEFHYKTLPTEYDTCHTTLMEQIKLLQKQGVKIAGVLSLGEGAEDFKLETQANNFDDVPGFPDNKGVIRVEQKIFSDHADDVIPMRFPFEAFGRIRTSKSPGFYVCNHLCAKMAKEFSTEKHPFFGFIHVPRTGMGGIFTADVCAAIIVNGFKKIGA